jgi:hypothetical protein
MDKYVTEAAAADMNSYDSKKKNLPQNIWPWELSAGDQNDVQTQSKQTE